MSQALFWTLGILNKSDKGLDCAKDYKENVVGYCGRDKGG